MRSWISFKFWRRNVVSGLDVGCGICFYTLNFRRILISYKHEPKWNHLVPPSSRQSVISAHQIRRKTRILQRYYGKVPDSFRGRSSIRSGQAERCPSDLGFVLWARLVTDMCEGCPEFGPKSQVILASSSAEHT
jgi:hypothetical protein